MSFRPAANDIAFRLTALRSLRLLNCGGCAAPLLPAASLLTRLTQLHIAGCTFDELPAAVTRLPQLQRLHLGYNNCTPFLPPALSRLLTLEALVLERWHDASLLVDLCPALGGLQLRMLLGAYPWDRIEQCYNKVLLRALAGVKSLRHMQLNGSLCKAGPDWRISLPGMREIAKLARNKGATFKSDNTFWAIGEEF